MKKLIVLAVFFLVGCIQVRCVPPLGQLVEAPADGRFDKTEIERFRKYRVNNTKVEHSGETYKTLVAYANDMHVFIKKYLWPGWTGVTGLYLNVVNNKRELKKAWEHCTKKYWIFGKSQPFSKRMLGFHCPFNGEITLTSNVFYQMVELYDHEEGHYQNDLDDEAAEFSSEYNARWKAFIRLSMNLEVGNWFANYINSTAPAYKKYRKIKNIGKYKAASLMFFFVANHYDGDLTKGAKFIFENNEKVLLKFFYKKLNAYNKNLTVRAIWETEVLKLWSGLGIQKYLRSIREKITTYNGKKKK